LILGRALVNGFNLVNRSRSSQLLAISSLSVLEDGDDLQVPYQSTD